jgi:hypothetical protein
MAFHWMFIECSSTTAKLNKGIAFFDKQVVEPHTLPHALGCAHVGGHGNEPPEDSSTRKDSKSLTVAAMQMRPLETAALGRSHER